MKEYGAERKEGNRRVFGLHAHEREVAVLPDFAVLDAVDHEGLVAGCAELGGVREVDLHGDGFAAEPVAAGLG